MLTPSSWELQTFFLSKKGPRRRNMWGVVKHSAWQVTILSMVVVFLVRKGPLGQRVSGFPVKGADLWGDLGNSRKVRESFGEVVLENGGFVPCRKQGILTKTAKMTRLLSSQ